MLHTQWPEAKRKQDIKKNLKLNVQNGAIAQHIEFTKTTREKRRKNCVRSFCLWFMTVSIKMTSALIIRFTQIKNEKRAVCVCA